MDGGGPGRRPAPGARPRLTVAASYVSSLKLLLAGASAEIDGEEDVERAIELFVLACERARDASARAEAEGRRWPR